MQLSGLIEFLISSELEKFISGSAHLKVGERLNGKVIDIRQDGKVLIDFLKFRVLANVKFPINKGEKISVTVENIGKNLKFVLNSEKSEVSAQAQEILAKIEQPDKSDIQQVLNQIKNLFSGEEQTSQNFSYGTKGQNSSGKGMNTTSGTDPILSSETTNAKAEPGLMGKAVEPPLPVRSAIDNLIAEFKPLDPAQEILKLVTSVKKLVENSGIFFERKMEVALMKLESLINRVNSDAHSVELPEIRDILKSDAKPNLLILRSFFAENRIEIPVAKTALLDSVKENIDSLLNQIGKQQENFVKSKNKPDLLNYFTFHIPLKDQKKAKLRVYYDKRNKKKSNSFSLSLLLVMDRLGPIRTDFLLVENDLNISFFVSEDKIKTQLERHLSEMGDRIKNLFRYLYIKVMVSKKKIREFDNEEIVWELDNTKGLVDVKV